MTMSTSQRAAEFALLRVVGGTRKQVLAMVGIEALIVLAIGALLGIVVGAASTVGVSRALTGSVSALTVPLLPVLGIVALGALLTLGSNLIPARYALRLDPIRQTTLKE
jgi:putative ABC transport system permease protein